MASPVLKVTQNGGSSFSFRVTRLAGALASRTSWRAWRRSLISAAAAIAVLAVAAVSVLAAAAPPRWLPPRNLSENGADAVIPDVRFDPKGNAVFVWAQAKGSSWTVNTVVRPSGGPWGAPQALSETASHVASPELAVAGAFAVAAWDRFDGKNLIVQAASRKGAQAWTAPATLSLGGRDAQAPAAAVNARGDAVVVWASVSLPGWTVQAAYRPAGGAWQPSVPIQPAVDGTSAPDVVIDSTGRAVAVWAATTTGSGWRVFASTRAADGTWSEPTAISGPDATGSIAPQLALEGTNDVLAVWSRQVGTNSVIESATFSAATGSWSPAARPFTVPHDALAPSVAVDKRGYGVIVWTSSDKAGLAVMASYRQPGKAWGDPVALSGTAAGALSPKVALDARGNGVAVWTQSIGGFSRVQAATVSGSIGTWSAARVLSKAGSDALTPEVDLDDAGDGAVVWARYGGKSFVIQGDGYDRNGPSLSNLSIPVTGTAGRRLAFAVTPRDVWSAVKTVRWTFGDGSASSVRATGHVYRHAGRFTARLTVVDAFGHVTSVRRIVTISAG